MGAATGAGTDRNVTAAGMPVVAGGTAAAGIVVTGIVITGVGTRSIGLEDVAAAVTVAGACA